MLRDREAGLNPWTSIFLKPRRTLRHVLATRAELWFLGVVAAEGILSALDTAVEKAWGDDFSLPLVLASALIAGTLSGALYYYLWGFLISWTGRWIGGDANARQVRAAITLPSVILIWSAPFWVPELLLIGNELFQSEAPLLDESPGLNLLLLVHGVIQLVLGIWALVAFLAGLSEVQGFSVWKAIGNILLAGILPAVVVVPLMILHLATL